MAIVHPKATLLPSKLDLLAPWLPTRQWYRGPATPELTRVAGYRFDDPAGEVGIETLLVATDRVVYQVPLTYRGAPLEGGEEWLVGTSEHSLLGPRWIYDGCRDPLYAATLTNTILTGTGGAEEYADIDGRRERREPTMTVRGSGAEAADHRQATEIVLVMDGDPTRIVTDAGELRVRRMLDGSGAEPHQGPAVLTGIWPDQPTPVPLATLNPS